MEHLSTSRLLMQETLVGQLLARPTLSALVMLS